MLNHEHKKRNIWLDLFKMFLCFLVVCIHFAGNHYTHHPLYRVAVPAFFMISGYFLFNADQVKRVEKAKSFMKRSAYYVVLGFVLYIAYGFVVCFIDKTDPSKYFVSLYYSDFIKNFLLLNSNPLKDAYHLWFVIALFVVSILHYLLVRYKKEKWYFWIIPLGIFVHLFFNGYVKYCGGTVVNMVYTRNALFFGLPMFGIGYLLARFNLHKFKWLKFTYLVLGLGCFYLQIMESNFMIREVYVSSIFSAAFLLLFFVGLKMVQADWYYNYVGKSVTFYVYLIHLGVGKQLEKYFTINNVYLKCFVIFLASLIIYEVIYLLIKFIKYIYEFIRGKMKNKNAMIKG